MHAKKLFVWESSQKQHRHRRVQTDTRLCAAAGGSCSCIAAAGGRVVDSKVSKSLSWPFQIMASLWLLMHAGMHIIKRD